MPGFGSGPFGTDPFGEFNWSRRVLFEQAPEIYRTADLEQGEYFRKYAEAQGVSFDNLRLKIGFFSNLRFPELVRTEYDETTTLRLGEVQRIEGPVQQSGLLATVSGVQAFTTLRGRFTFNDIGKELSVSGSALGSNNRRAVITSIVTPTTVLTNPPYLPDAGPLRWSLREAKASTVEETIVEVLGGDVSEVTPGWILTDGFADFTVQSRQQFKAAASERALLTDREGSDGSIAIGTLRFASPSANFTSKDIGKHLTISNTVNPVENEGRFEILDVESATEAVLDAPALVSEPTGTLVWAVLRRPMLVLRGSSTLRGPVEQTGDSGSVFAAGPPGVFDTISGRFSATDVGKLFLIHSPGDTNNGTYEVLSVLSATRLRLDTTLVITGATFHWELRDPTGVGDETQVEVRAPSLLQFLAQDFGIEIDTREDEEFQRRWVYSVSKWIGLKGTRDGYDYLSQLTGYSARVPGVLTSALYRVTQDIYDAALVAGADAWAVGEADEGRSGRGGDLITIGGFGTFETTGTFVFTQGDVGRSLEISGSSAGNDGLYTIEEVSDDNNDGTLDRLRFRAADSLAADESDPIDTVGSFDWRIVRLYSEEAPLLPVMDEINSDLMTARKTAAVFTVDKYCWEQLPSPWSTLLGAGDGLILIDSVDPPTGAAIPVIFTVTGRGDFDVAVGLGEGRWKLRDSGAVAHFLETVPSFPVSSSGTDGSLTGGAPASFTVPAGTGSFTAGDVGKLLVITEGIATNNQGYLIDAFVDADTLTLDLAHAPTTPDVNNGALGWTIFTPDQGGADGSLTLSAPARFSSPTASFTAADIGKRLVIEESGSANRGTYIIASIFSGTAVDLDAIHTPTTPDVNNGSLVWALFGFEFEVIATTPPATGAATLEYICPERLNCDYCKSNKVLVEASTALALESGFERLTGRLDQGKPKHVELVQAFGVEAEATLSLVAEVDSP